MSSQLMSWTPLGIWWWEQSLLPAMLLLNTWKSSFPRYDLSIPAGSCQIQVHKASAVDQFAATVRDACVDHAVSRIYQNCYSQMPLQLRGCVIQIVHVKIESGLYCIAHNVIRLLSCEAMPC